MVVLCPFLAFFIGDTFEIKPGLLSEKKKKGKNIFFKLLERNRLL